jgi:hypothetical protein
VWLLLLQSAGKPGALQAKIAAAGGSARQQPVSWASIEGEALDMAASWCKLLASARWVLTNCSTLLYSTHHPVSMNQRGCYYSACCTRHNQAHGNLLGQAAGISQVMLHIR